MRAIRPGAAIVGLVGVILTVSGPRAFVGASGPRESMLTPVSWLAQHLSDPNLVILQVGDAGTYKKEHVPGAQAADMASFAAPMDRSANAPASQNRLELPTDEQLKATLETFGMTDASRIVIVESDNWYSPATRIYLTLVHAGFGARTTLLDGGLTAWKAAGQSTMSDVPAVKATTLAALKTTPVTVDAAYVQAHEKTSGFVILDARSPAAWQGVENAAPRNAPEKFGHIPGSHSLPLEELWDDSKSALRPEAELEKIFAAAGVKPGDTVIGYCYVGQRATATLFAAETLGHPVLLYDGSMEEWVRLNLPLEMPVKKSPR